MCSRTFRRATLVLLLATGPLLTACELLLDFDRSPLQPVYEAGVEEEADSSSAAPSEAGADAAREGGGEDAATEAAAQDSGMDAEGG